MDDGVEIDKGDVDDYVVVVKMMSSIMYHVSDVLIKNGPFFIHFFF